MISYLIRPPQIIACWLCVASHVHPMILYHHSVVSTKDDFHGGQSHTVLYETQSEEAASSARAAAQVQRQRGGDGGDTRAEVQ